MIQLDTLTLSNVGVWDNLEIPLKDQGVVLLVGRNGIGKSTIVDSIQTALYGQTERYKLLRSLMQYGAESSSFMLTGTAFGEAFKIRRILTESKHLLKLEIDQKDNSSVTLPATQERLNDFIRTPWNIFSNIITLSGEPVLFTEDDQYQKSFMEKMLGLEIYRTAKTLATEARQAVESRLMDKKLDLQNHTTRQVLLQQQITLVNEKEQAVRESKIRQLEASIIEAESERDGLKTRRDEIRGGLLKMRDDLHSIPSDAEGAFRKKEYELQGCREAASKSEATLESLNRTLADFKEGTCPFCLQEAKNAPGVGRLKHQITKVEAVFLEEKKKMEKVQQEREVAMQAYHEYSVKTKTLYDKIAVGEDLYGKTESALSTIIYRINGLKNQLSLVKTEDSPSAIPLIRELEVNEKKIDLVHKEIQGETEVLKTLLFCEEAFGDRGIKSLLIEQYLIAISKDMNELLEFITDRERSCLLLPTSPLAKGGFKDKLTLTVRNNNNGALMQYDGCSSGDKAVVNVSALFAFHDLLYQQLGVKWKFLMLDELFEHVDEERLKNVFKLLKRKVKEFGTILVVSHRVSVMREYFETVWEVVRNGTKSELIFN